MNLNHVNFLHICIISKNVNFKPDLVREFYSGSTMVLQWFYSGPCSGSTVVLRWFYSGPIQWFYHGSTMVLQSFIYCTSRLKLDIFPPRTTEVLFYLIICKICLFMGGGQSPSFCKTAIFGEKIGKRFC